MDYIIDQREDLAVTFLKNPFLDYDKLGELETAKEQIKLENNKLKHIEKNVFTNALKAFKALKQNSQNLVLNPKGKDEKKEKSVVKSTMVRDSQEVQSMSELEEEFDRVVN